MDFQINSLFGTYFLLILAFFVPTKTNGWLGMFDITAAGISSIYTPDHCDLLPGLVNRQISICKRNLELMNSVQNGAKISITECQNQFSNRRWNCSTSDTFTVFGNVLDNGTREAAFVNAVSSAGVAYAVTLGCSTGTLTQCGCDRTVTGRSPDGFTWSGCSDNVAYGVQFSRIFVDARETKSKTVSFERRLMNLHNNEAGRRAIEDNMKIECKCHGVSASCEVKTCWRTMPAFREIGNILKEKFDGATEVEQRRINSRKQLVPINPYFKAHTGSDLVYLKPSPDFCERDPQVGSLGTQGRRCNRTSRAIDGCELLCCGRGFNTHEEVVEELCSCQFHWCCFVKCRKCRYTVEVHTCK